MKRFALALALSTLPLAAVHAQTPETAIAGTRLDISATGESTRVPDLVVINAGVVTEAPTAQAALSQNAQQMRTVMAALRRQGIEARDIQTASINLNPRYDYEDRSEPRLIGYTATNQLTVRFRDIERAGPVIDVLVSEGVNQINGPSLQIENPDEALDEARRDALTRARARAELYASALGMSVIRIVAVSEAGAAQPPMPYAAQARAVSAEDSTQIAPGEQTVTANVSVTFELR